jgi:hypothetical protein
MIRLQLGPHPLLGCLEFESGTKFEKRYGEVELRGSRQDHLQVIEEDIIQENPVVEKNQ